MLTISKSFIAEHNFRWCYWRSWDENNVSVTQPRSQEERPWEQGCLLPTFACFLRSRTLLQYSLVPRSSPWRDPGNEVVNTLVWYRCLQELCKWWYLVLYSWAYCKLPCTLSSTLHLALKFPKIKESRTCQLMATEMFEGLINIYWGQKIWVKVYGWTKWKRTWVVNTYSLLLLVYDDDADNIELKKTRGRRQRECHPKM